MANKIVTFGEVMMRLSPSNHKMVQQSNEFEFFFGGTEMNVSASLATLNCNVQHISAVTNDFIGDAAIAKMRSYGIKTDQIIRNDHPLGLYILEVGSAIRPSRISYNRLNGSFANINPELIDWEDILSDCSHFHWTGITPGISENAYIALKQALAVAKSNNITITTDPAYRSNLWKYGKSGKEILKELIGYSTIFIGGVNEINEILNTSFTNTKEDFIKASVELINQIPSIQKVYDKIRIGLSADNQITQGQAWCNDTYIETDQLQVEQVVDRIGTGDAFAAGLIYGLQQNWPDEKTLQFANAACALKHTILGDVNLASVEDINEVLNGNTGGRIKR